MSGHVSLIEEMPTWGIDLETLVKTVLVLKCGLRLGADMVDDVLNHHHMPLPTLHVAARARRELRPKTPMLGDSRHVKLAISQRSAVALQSTVAVPGIYGKNTPALSRNEF